MPEPISDEYVTVEDEYLSEEINKKGITHLNELTPIDNDIYLWQGDITTITADAIVNAEIIKAMYEQQKDMKIPSDLISKCPHCGKPLKTNLRADDQFVQDEGWYKASERYSNFLRCRQNQKILFLKLGVGYNTPVIIKYPFWQMTAKNPNATYACINMGEAFCPDEIPHQSICIDMEINNVLSDIL